jgi:UDP-2,3-diacylglucosamine pyrophosphatase LpxH
MTAGGESGTELPDEEEKSRRGLFGLEPLPEDRSIIVVSDLHLGGREDTGTALRFCRFLDHLTTGSPVVSDLCTREGNIRSKRLLPPEKFILLGDILEVWDSRNSDRNCAFLNGILPFLKLRDMDCDLVYVTGNHDEDIAEFVESYDEMRKQDKEKQEKAQETGQGSRCQEPEEGDGSGCSPADWDILHSENKAGRKRPESLKMRWRGSRTLEISPRHFPAPRVPGGKLGLKAGSVKYAFIHGHQFDKEQIPYTLSQGLGRRLDPVDFIQDLASISVTKKMKPLFPVLNVFLLIILARLYVIPELAPVTTVLGMLTGIALFFLFLAGVYQFGFKYREYPSSLLIAGVSAAAAVLMAGLLVAGYYQGLFLLLFLLSLFALGFFSIPVIFALVKRRAYNAMAGARGKSPTELIHDKMFDPKEYKYKAEVLIFGHTHYADFESFVKPETVRLLVNAGSWVCEPQNMETGDFDTFVYIDKSGICCLRWNDTSGRIECFCKEKGSPAEKVSLCDYITRHEVKLST